MSFTVFEIDDRIEVITEMLVDPETGEILSEEQARLLIDEFQMQKDKKIEYLCKLIKNYSAEAEALKAQKQAFEKRQKAAENKAKSIKNYIRYVLNGEKWKAEDASVSVSYRTTKDIVKVDNIEAIPDDYFKKPHDETHLMKTVVKDMLSSGTEIAGVHLEESVSVIIK